MSDTQTRNRRKQITAEVISVTGSKSLKVASFFKVQHPLYKKEVKQKTIYHVHDEESECKVGDRIEIMETRPISKSKRWRLVRVVEKARESNI